MDPSVGYDGAPGMWYFAYSLTSDRRDASLRPSTRYMELLITGALEHGLPAEYVATLRAVPARAPSATARALRPLVDAAMARLRR